jgi:dimethylhistidine N-methyltransferase
VNQRVTFHDYHPHTPKLLDVAIGGLARSPKVIPPKFFYDEAGSRLFDLICEQPEYYLPEVERGIFIEHAHDIAARVGEVCVLIEPGAGNSAKVKLFLEHLRPRAYVPMDISGAYLRSSSESLAAEYRWLQVHAACLDFTHDMRLPGTVPKGRRVVFFPGSSLGNFNPAEATDFLRLIREMVGEGGMLLIGVDTKKPTAVLNAAYNDAAGVTAEFNLNLLRRINRELDAHIDIDRFEHKAYYNPELGRVEMHLVSLSDQLITIQGHRFRFLEGETLHTENSYKYAPQEFLGLAQIAGFADSGHWTDERGYFAVYLLSATG